MALLLAGAAAADYAAPRTDFGQPDLQGTWTNATFTTLERPEQFDALVLTPDEALSVVDARNALYADNDRPDKVDGKLTVSNDPGGYNSFWMDEGEGLAVIDDEIRSSIIVEPADGRIPYSFFGRLNFYRAFMQWTRFDGPETRPLGERCIVGFGSTGGPPMLPVLYNNHYQIVQNEDHVLILVEMNHDVRTVRLGGSHPPADVRKWMGDSIGHWEDDTLVVETTNFHPSQSVRAALKHQLYASQDLKVIERFTRIADDRIHYAFEMHDPRTYSQVWKGELPFRRTDARIYEYACHEGNYAMGGILAGARRAERDGEEVPFVRRLAAWLGPPAP